MSAGVRGHENFVYYSSASACRGKLLIISKLLKRRNVIALSAYQAPSRRLGQLSLYVLRERAAKEINRMLPEARPLLAAVRLKRKNNVCWP